MLKHPAITLERIDKALSSIYWSDINLHGIQWEEAPADAEAAVTVEHIDCDPFDSGRIPYGEAGGVSRALEAAAAEGDGARVRRVQPGDSFGPAWRTFWFRVTVQVPAAWVGADAPVVLLWRSEAEAMVWHQDQCLSALNGGNPDRCEAVLFPRGCASDAERRVVLYVEMACNGLFGVGDGSMIGPPDAGRHFAVKSFQLARVNQLGRQLYYDFKVIADLAKEMKDSVQGAQAMWTANAMLNLFERGRPETWTACVDLAHQYFRQTRILDADSVVAVGHCHIDTAWLWPFDETRRKVARSWASTIRLMEAFPEYVFVASQAQQFAWLKTSVPELYSRIQAAARRGQFVPVGGCWVEMDANLPTGESFVRQFLLGQRFFAAEFGAPCDVFWLPDTFGYSAQLPQLMAGCGMKRFLTQKLSWSLINKFPHSTFVWEGLDGTRVVTHFPPADTYSAAADVPCVLKTSNNNKDKDRCTTNMLLFGHGDGGGGPDVPMLEQLRRISTIAPSVQQASPSKFFEAAEATQSRLCVWSGELYLELHQGTLTSQAKTKAGVRACEGVLHTVEALCVIGSLMGLAAPYPRAQLQSWWETTLLCEFHDVLPGSSIAAVHRDAERLTAQVMTEARSWIGSYMVGFAEHLTPVAMSTDSIGTLLVANPTSAPLPVYASDAATPHVVAPYSVAVIASPALLPETSPLACTLRTVQLDGNDAFEIDNNLITVVLQAGRVVQLTDKRAKGRAALSSHAVGNLLRLHDDVPFYWDAWDVMPYYAEKTVQTPEATAQEVLVNTPSHVAIRFSYAGVGRGSSIVQTVHVRGDSAMVEFETTVDWHEAHKILRVDFPLNVRSAVATFETQFGTIQRPTHTNTSWDTAKHEVSGQRWADMSEYSYGVSVISNDKHGYSCRGNVIGLSLLRSPKKPDPDCDMGEHTFTYALYPHVGRVEDSGILTAATQIQYKPVVLTLPTAATAMCKQLFNVSMVFPADALEAPIVLDTVKRAEDSEAVICRLYEAKGGHARARLECGVRVSTAFECNLLEAQEREVTVVQSESGSSIAVDLSPYQVKTLMLIQ